MWNRYWTFLDYLELRRRVERRLARANWLFLHIALFVAMTIGKQASENANLYSFSFSYYIDPSAGYVMAIWSALLALHGLWLFSRSGAAAGRRSAAIEAEMRERVRNDDSYLSEHPKDLFRLHALLEENIGKRARSVSLLMVYTTLNALIWLPWAIFDGARDSFAWMASPMLAVLIFLPLLLSTLLYRERNERALRQQIETLSETPRDDEIPVKYKHEPQRAMMRLSDDGELLEIEDERQKTKRQC